MFSATQRMMGQRCKIVILDVGNDAHEDMAESNMISTLTLDPSAKLSNPNHNTHRYQPDNGHVKFQCQYKHLSKYHIVVGDVPKIHPLHVERPNKHPFYSKIAQKSIDGTCHIILWWIHIGFWWDHVMCHITKELDEKNSHAALPVHVPLMWTWRGIYMAHFLGLPNPCPNTHVSENSGMSFDIFDIFLHVFWDIWHILHVFLDASFFWIFTVT